MDKKGFFEELERQLSLKNLPREEISRTLEWYGEVISDRVEEGETEENAVAALGSPEDIARETAGCVPQAEKDSQKRRQKNEKHTESFGDVREVRVDAGFLDVILRPSLNGQVTVDTSEADRLACTFSPEGGYLTVSKIDAFLPFSHAEGHITVYIPNNFNGSAYFNSKSGDFDAENITAGGDIALKTASGDIKLRSVLSGKALEAQSASGDISAENCSAGERLTLKSASGDVEASEIKSGNAFSISTASGDVGLGRCEAGREITAQTASGDIEAGNCSCGAKLNLSSASGDIDVEFVSAGKEISLSSVSGDVSGSVVGRLSDYTVRAHTRTGENSLPTKSEGGDRILNVKTVSGDIDLRFASGCE